MTGITERFLLFGRDKQYILQGHRVFPPGTVWRDYLLRGYSPQVYLWMTLIALGPQLLGHTAFNWALANCLQPLLPCLSWGTHWFSYLCLFYF